ncbi:MAG: hypothetical protein NT038_08260 [Euryarchaeota archaeon]|nr:hypothetical protein [Euryarchaeota archaeon]
MNTDTTIPNGYEYTFDNTSQHGQYNYTIWAVDYANNTNTTPASSFFVSQPPEYTIVIMNDMFSHSIKYK